jgi:tRNA dimethylallyltransferase
MSSKPQIIALVGPTASGKSALALLVAKKFNGEVVSADSRQIYRGMDIGTAKPSTEEMHAIPHHLVDIKDPDEDYTVAEYKEDAEAAIGKILAKGKLPILAGGTGLYVRAVLENLDIPKIKADPALRIKLEKEIAEEGLGLVFKKLVALDPDAEYVVDSKNPRRVVRALEVTITTGEPFTVQQKKNKRLFDAMEIGLELPPEVLRERIDARADQMVTDGLIGEVQKLIKLYGVGADAFDAIGYREIIQHLEDGLPLTQAVHAIKMNTWHYAKRQMTWFKKDKAVHWVHAPAEAIAITQDFLDKNRRTIRK